MKNERIEIHLTPEESKAITEIANDQGRTRKNYIENLCRKEINKHTQTTALDLLKNIVEWWEKGHRLDPPIEEAKDLLKKIKKTAP